MLNVQAKLQKLLLLLLSPNSHFLSVMWKNLVKISRVASLCVPNMTDRISAEHPRNDKTLSKTLIRKILVLSKKKRNHKNPKNEMNKITCQSQRLHLSEFWIQLFFRAAYRVTTKKSF